MSSQIDRSPVRTTDEGDVPAAAHGRTSDLAGARPAAPPQNPNAGPPDLMTARARALGLPSATALVIGSIIGTGVFTMPAVMASAGTSSLLVLGVISIGALLLGTMFGQLTKRIPTSDGGLYAYAKHEFGDYSKLVEHLYL